ncbi:MAG: hypothetical protein MUE63_14030, partial [Xanthomonadales bacterium]|nr:hypothetical protein [Xanthomonadales bacterium]
MFVKIFKEAARMAAVGGLTLGLTVGFGSTAQAAAAVSLDELLQQVKQGRVKDAAENQKRIEEFQRDRSRQQQLL